jgi:C1A family cysteine protease
MHEADRALGRTQNLLMGLAIVLTLLAFYAYFRKKRAEAKEKEYQDQLYAYTTEIKQLTANRDITLANIQELISREEKDQQKISQLEAEAKEAEGAIKQLNKSIKKLLDDEATKLKQGKMLYDHIAEGNTSVNWSSKEEELFCRYYAAINFQSYNRIRKVKRSAKLSAHNLFYLILKELGYSDEDVRRIMVLSPEGLRSIRSRTKPAKQEK